ncbi:MAG: site-specific integrase, partial [Clostridia bacterium]|nr:site-specific integrase [Clostridia bacterium]
KRKMFYSSELTEKKAERDIMRQMVEFEAKQQEKAKGKTFQEVADEWEEEHYPKLEYNTSSRYKPHVQYAIKHFDGKLIQDIIPNDIKGLLQSRIKDGRAAKTVTHQLSVVKMIFEFACVNRYIINNPCQYIHVPPNLPKHKRTIPDSDIIQIIVENINMKFGLAACFILYTGLRRGELLALCWSDIDFKNKIINVNKSVYYVGNKPYIKQPKTEAGIRTVILPDILADNLPRNKKGLVFPGKDGKPMAQHYFESQWNEYINTLNINVHPHQLRHAYASYLLHDSGIDVKTAQELMGHADIKTTQNIYTQVTDNKLDEARKKINALSVCSQTVVSN